VCFRIKKIEVEGISDMESYFYDKTVEHLNKLVDPIFLRSHITAVSPSVSHPSSIIQIKGYFLNNAPLIHAQFILESSPTTTFTSAPCAVLEAIRIECIIPPSISTAFGEYFIKLTDASGTQISDQNIAIVYVAPKPTILSVTP